MNINVNNWEAYAVDYFDGTLSAQEQKELLAYVDSHPEIKDEFYSYQEFTVAPGKVVFKEKQALKQPIITPYGTINENNYEEYIVLYIDNELSENQEKEFLIFIKKNGFLKKEIELLAATKLNPDKKIVFTDKDLIRKNAVLSVWIRWSAVAAVFLTGLFLLKPYIFNRSLPVRNFTVSISSLPSLNYTSMIPHDTITRLPVQKIPVVGLKSKKIQQYDIITLKPMKPLEKSMLLSAEINKEIINSGYFESPPLGIMADDKKHYGKSLAMKVISKPIKNIGKLLAKRERISKQPEYQEPAAVKIIDNGITVFNKITGSDIIVAKVYTNGNLTKYQLEGNNWQIKRKIGRR